MAATSAPPSAADHDVQAKPNGAIEGGHIDIQFDHDFSAPLKPGQAAALTIPVVRVVESVPAPSGAGANPNALTTRPAPVAHALDVQASLHHDAKSGKDFTLLHLNLNGVSAVLKLQHGTEGKRLRPFEALVADIKALQETDPDRFWWHFWGAMVVLALSLGVVKGFFSIIFGGVGAVFSGPPDHGAYGRRY